MCVVQWPRSHFQMFMFIPSANHRNDTHTESKVEAFQPGTPYSALVDTDIALYSLEHIDNRRIRFNVQGSAFNVQHRIFEWNFELHFLKFVSHSQRFGKHVVRSFPDIDYVCKRGH